jgi:allophanate hydrolase subunit 1
LAGDRGLVVEFGTHIDVAVNNQVRALALTLETARIRGLLEVVPTYRSLGIQYDPARLSVEDLRARVEATLATLDPTQLPPPRVVHLPTCYGGEFGPDLPFVVEHSGLSEAEIVRPQPDAHHVHDWVHRRLAYLGGSQSPRPGFPRHEPRRRGGQWGSVAARPGPIPRKRPAAGASSAAHPSHYSILCGNLPRRCCRGIRSSSIRSVGRSTTGWSGNISGQRAAANGRLGN